MEPAWLQAARGDLGTRELPGAPTAPKIAGWLSSLGAWWNDDETPWCGVAVAHWMQGAGQSLPEHWYRAKGWLDWGLSLTVPVLGCVVVFERAGGGHVGLVVGKDAGGHLMVLGGNQGDAVRISAFEMARVVGYRWPGTDRPQYAELPLLLASGATSTNEA